ncbi:MAG: DUF4851 domain-containing protein [Deltaproteobacteria bacterium]|nr:DUF4851 domain-containing protein [Deltaproteobacteria bacterium]
MKTCARILSVFFAGLLLAGCSPARTGVVDNALTTNRRPAVSIKAAAPFSLADCGRVWVAPKTDLFPGAANASFDYALYTDDTASPVSKMAYAAIIRLENPEDWNFVPQGKTVPGSFGARKKVESVDREGFIYTVHVPSAGDWASELLATNGRAVPEAWIAKRWLFSLDSGARGLAEYREPWPADLDVPESDIMLLRASHADFLREFERRAFAAFIFGSEPGDFPSPPPASKWLAAPVLPDVTRLAGPIISVDRSADNIDK